MEKKKWLLKLKKCKKYFQNFSFTTFGISSPEIELNPIIGKTILIVEDNEQLRKRYVEILLSLDYKVFEASNNTEAFHFLKTVDNNLHLVITNIQRKDGTGLEMLSKIHEYLPYYVPVLLISSQIENYKDTIHKAHEFKGVKKLIVIQKPLSLEVFLKNVHYSSYSPTPYFPTSFYLTQLEIANTMKKNDFPSIMLVDDEDYMLKLYEKMLFGLPYNLFTFKEGFSALHFLGSSPVKIDLIITNIKMPLVDGYDLLLRTHEFIQYSISALVITALYTPELKYNYMIREYENMTLVNVLPKPIDYFTFHKAVCKALDTKATCWMN